MLEAPGALGLLQDLGKSNFELHTSNQMLILLVPSLQIQGLRFAVSSKFPRVPKNAPQKNLKCIKKFFAIKIP